jgi:hypothetical protein
MSTATKVGLGLGAAAVAALGTRSYLRTQVQDKKRAQLRAAEPVISDMLRRIDEYTQLLPAEDPTLYKNEISSLNAHKALIPDIVSRIEEAIKNHADITLLEAELETEITRCNELLGNIFGKLDPVGKKRLWDKAGDILVLVGMALGLLGVLNIQSGVREREFQACKTVCRDKGTPEEVDACRYLCVRSRRRW